MSSETVLISMPEGGLPSQAADIGEHGDVNGPKGGRLTGWYTGELTGGEVVAYLNGEEWSRAAIEVAVTVKTAGESRAMPIGFVFELGEIPKMEVSRFTFRHAESGFDFDGKEIAFCPLVNRYREQLRAIFFPQYYKSRYELWDLNDREAFNHFTSVGLYRDENPNPWFSAAYYRTFHGNKLINVPVPLLSYLHFEKQRKVKASEHFDPGFYTEHYQDLADLDHPLGHYVQDGHRQGRYGTARLLPDRLLGEISQMCDFEPDLEEFLLKSRHIEQYPRLTGSTFLPSYVARTIGTDFDAVVMVPYLSCGGADLISLFILKAYQQHFGIDKVLLIVSDRSENSVPTWLNGGSQTLFLDEHATFFGMDERVETLHTLIGTLAPKIVMNVNSHAGWLMYERYGRQLASVANLHAYLFCFDYMPDGRRAGYIRHFLPQTIGFLTSVSFDNAAVIEEVLDLYGFSRFNRSKLRTIYIPLPRDATPRLAGPGDRNGKKKVLWTGRLARQKRPELLVDIAESMPWVEFVVYGPEGDAEISPAIVEGRCANIDYRGVYKSLSDLDLDEFDAFLNTSAWDGLPTVLIQMAGLGLPIVTSSVGGIKELITDETGWLVEDHSEVAAYSRRLNEVIIQPAEACKRARAGRRLVAKRHEWKHFFDALKASGAFAAERSEENRNRLKLTHDRRSYASV